jgi:predicted GNAT family N-acyltransferase
MPVFTIKTLTSRTDLSKFDCSKDDDLKLNEFIHEEALEYQKNGEGVTHLFYRQEKLVGFVTLAMGAIKRNKKVDIANYSKINVPALFLGRLAVDNSERGKGVGLYLLEYCVGFAIKLAKNAVGCRYVTLVTKKGYRSNFYQKQGFKIVKSKLDKDLDLLSYNLQAA